ncbi:MAG: hypothetical protein WCP34_16055, partial [Pseudomonadota bacterium]
VTFLAPGRCVLTANQAGNAHFHPAPQTIITLIVSAKITQAISGFRANFPDGIIDGSDTLIAIANSGLAVTFGSMTPDVCAVAGNAVNFLAIGTCIVTADQAGNTLYNPAPQAILTLPVRINTPQSISGFSVNPENGTFGHEALLSITGSGDSGNPVVFASTTPDVCKVTGNVVNFVGTGVCTLTANQTGNARFGPAPQATLTLPVSMPQPTHTPPGINMDVLNLLKAAHGTYYDDNSMRATLFDELGNQCVMVVDYGLPTFRIYSILGKDGNSMWTVVNGVNVGFIDMATGIQTSLYNPDGTLNSYYQGHLTPVNVLTGNPIAGLLPADRIGYVIHWNSITIEPPPAPSRSKIGFEAPATMKGESFTYDHQSIRIRKKAQSKKFFFYFTWRDTSPLHVQAIRLLTMNHDNSLSYLNDDDADYRAFPGEDLFGGDPPSLYTGNTNFLFNYVKGKRKHGIVIEYRSIKTLSAFEMVVCGDGLDHCYDGRLLPTNVLLTFMGVDGNEHQAAKITGFVFDCAAGESRVLRVNLHDDFRDDIDVGIELTIIPDKTLVNNKIKANEPLSLTEYLIQWLPRSTVFSILKMAKAGKTPKEIRAHHPEVPQKIILLAFSTPLVERIKTT